MDYFEATVHGLAVSRCPLTLRRKKLYTQRRRGQCHIRKSSWRLPMSISLQPKQQSQIKDSNDKKCVIRSRKTKQSHNRYNIHSGLITRNQESISFLKIILSFLNNVQIVFASYSMCLLSQNILRIHDRDVLRHSYSSHIVLLGHLMDNHQWGTYFYRHL